MSNGHSEFCKNLGNTNESTFLAKSVESAESRAALAAAERQMREAREALDKAQTRVDASREWNGK